jgi:hypothetical protein
MSRQSHTLIAILLLIILVGFGCRKEGEPEVVEIAEQRAGGSTRTEAEYVGHQACIDCHKRQYDLYIGSDHDMRRKRQCSAISIMRSSIIWE